MNRGLRIGAVAGCFLMAAIRISFGPAQAADWQEDLTRQILHDEACEVSFMSQVVERIVEGRRVIMAKVRCEDKRSFDAMRPGDDEAFQFKACEVPNAETC